MSVATAAAAHRYWGPRSAEFIASYLEDLADLPVGASVEPGWLLARLPEVAPTEPDGMEAVLADLQELVIPAMVHWQSPGFHGYFPANSTWPAALADYIAAGLGQQGMIWATSPAATELEMRMLDWVADLCALPGHFRHSADGPGGGVIQDSASSGTLVAILAGRERAGGRESLHQQVIYASVEAHSSVVKGARIAGFREQNIRALPTRDDLSMDPAALAEAIATDRSAGLVPSVVVATVGTTSTMAVDPVPEIAEAASGLWLHVDAAMAGAATVCVEHRDLNAGLERVDSYLFNPHKWWGVTFDCSTMWVRDRTSLTEALAITPPYLQNTATESGEVVDFRDWQVPLGRRFRALKLWFVLRTFGAEGLRSLIRAHVTEAQWLVAQLEDSTDWILAAEPNLNLVCVRHSAGADETQRVLDAVNNSGRALLTSTVVAGEPVIRLSIGSPYGTHEDTVALWGLLNSL